MYQNLAGQIKNFSQKDNSYSSIIWWLNDIGLNCLKSKEWLISYLGLDFVIAAIVNMVIAVVTVTFVVIIMQ